jgi:hypothetical protein
LLVALALALLLCPRPGQAESPLTGSSDGALVSLPLEEYERLLGSVLGPAWRCSKAIYRIEATTTSAVVEARLEGTLSGEGMRELPLPGGSLPLEQVRLDGAPAVLLPGAGGGSTVPCGQPGPHLLEVRFQVPVQLLRGGASLTFGVPLAAAGEARLSVPGQVQRFQCLGGMLRSSKSEAGRSMAEFALVPGADLTLLWGAERKDGASDLGPVQADVLYSLAGGGVRGRLAVGPASLLDQEVEVRLEAGAEVLSVRAAEGGRPLRYELLQPLPPGAGPGLRVLASESEAAVPRSAEARRTDLGAAFLLEFEQPLPRGVSRVRLPLPAVTGATPQSGIVGVARPAAGRISRPESAELPAIDTSAAADGRRRLGCQEAELLESYSKLPAAIQFDWQPPAAQVLTAPSAQHLKVRTLLAADGRRTSWLRYRMRAEGPLPLRFVVPPSTEILGALEDGWPLPVGRRGSAAAVALRPTEGEQTRELELVVQETGPALGTWSAVQLALPTAVFDVHAVSWELGIAAGWSVRWTQGSLERQAPAGADEPPSPPAGVSVVMERGLTPKETPLELQAYVSSDFGSRLLDLIVFALALGLPLGAVFSGQPSRTWPVALTPAVLLTLLTAPLLPAPWSPLVAGVVLAGLIGMLRRLASLGAV